MALAMDTQTYAEKLQDRIDWAQALVDELTAHPLDEDSPCIAVFPYSEALCEAMNDAGLVDPNEMCDELDGEIFEMLTERDELYSTHGILPSRIMVAAA